MQKILYSITLLFLISLSFYDFQNDQSQNIYKTFQNWKQQNKKYYTQNEEQYRLQIYIENSKKIEEFNKQDHSYKQKLNKFADLAENEFVELFLTLNTKNVDLNKHDKRGCSKQKYYPIDWTQQGKVPNIKDQGDCGSCWAFSAVGAIEINNNILYNEAVNLSEQELVDCAGLYGNAGCDGGWMDSAFEYVNDQGLAYSIDYPYTAQDGVCKSVKSKYLRKIETLDLDFCNEIYQQIQKSAISVAVDATNWRFYSEGVFNDCNVYLNHGVILVGNDAEGNWKVRNSWGVDWGNQGYITLSNWNTCGICLAASVPILS